MDRTQKFSEIIERIEHLRTMLNLNKSRFSADIGMKPQTYNNFIGAQGSKPNVELIYGIVQRFGVSPMWLLMGKGPVFADDARSGAPPVRPPAYPDLPQTLRQVREEQVGFTPDGTDAPSSEALRTELQAVAPILEQTERDLSRVEAARLDLVERCIGLLRRYYEVDPAAAVGELRALLQRVDARIVGNGS